MMTYKAKQVYYKVNIFKIFPSIFTIFLVLKVYLNMRNMSLRRLNKYQIHFANLNIGLTKVELSFD